MDEERRTLIAGCIRSNVYALCTGEVGITEEKARQIAHWCEAAFLCHTRALSLPTDSPQQKDWSI